MLKIRIIQKFSDKPDFVAFPKESGVNEIIIREVQAKIHCTKDDHVLVDTTHGKILYSVADLKNTDGVVELSLHKVGTE